MAWEARSGLKLKEPIIQEQSIVVVGMAWEARSGLKHCLLPGYGEW